MKLAAHHLLWIIPLALATAIVIVIAVCDAVVTGNARGRTTQTVGDVPHHRYCLLLGTSPLTVRRTRNHSFHNRIAAAAQLFHAGKVERIIASGGDYSSLGGRDEPKSMADCLVNAGVPRDSIDLDYDGQRTILSIINAKRKYGLDSVVIVSQKYHCERALMQADHYGLTALGFNAANTPAFIDRARNWSRERLARVKLMIDLLKNQ